MTPAEYEAVRQSYRDDEWRKRKNRQVADIWRWIAAFVLVSVALLASVWKVLR